MSQNPETYEVYTSSVCSFSFMFSHYSYWSRAAASFLVNFLTQVNIFSFDVFDSVIQIIPR